jgi:Ca-activated chloride channel family protein
MVVGSSQGGQAHGQHAIVGPDDVPAPARRRRSGAIVWIALVAVVSIAVAGAGYVWRSNSSGSGTGCGGDPVTTTIAASPDQHSVMSELANRWNADEPRIDGTCVAVNVVSAEPSKVAAALGSSWSEGRDGPRPDVWAPDSIAWTFVAAARPEAAPLLPKRAPSVASSAIVLALPRPMAEAMGWPKRPIKSIDLIGALATHKSWADFGHPNWGAFRFGMPDPTRSAAALSVLLSVIDRNADSKVSNEEISQAVSFSSAVSAFVPSSDTFFDEISRAGSPEEALASATIFPTDERELAAYRPTGSALDFVPVYPGDEATFADHPYAILKAPWVDETRADTAAKFRDYLLSVDGQRAYGAAGFRDAAGTAKSAPLLSEERGYKPEVRSSNAVPDPEAVNQIIAQWSALQRPVSVLIVLDTSGSMNDRAPGLPVTRLQLLQQAAVKGIGLLNNLSSMALWQFSSKLTPTTDYRELVPLGPASAKVGDMPRKQALIAAVQGLRANGGTGLYDTIDASFKQMQQTWQQGSINMIMVITDGKNEDDKGISQTELLANLQRGTRPDRPTPILGIAVGPEADAAALAKVSGATGGRTFVAKSDSEVLEQIVLAFAGRLR